MRAHVNLDEGQICGLRKATDDKAYMVVCVLKSQSGSLEFEVAREGSFEVYGHAWLHAWLPMETECLGFGHRRPYSMFM